MGRSMAHKSDDIDVETSGYYVSVSGDCLETPLKFTRREFKKLIKKCKKALKELEDIPSFVVPNDYAPIYSGVRWNDPLYATTILLSQRVMDEKKMRVSTGAKIWANM